MSEKKPTVCELVTLFMEKMDAPEESVLETQNIFTKIGMDSFDDAKESIDPMDMNALSIMYSIIANALTSELPEFARDAICSASISVIYRIGVMRGIGL